ncbi:hypothetical protein [Cupriavidus sp. BIC8F]|uniref:hypothetical protein n=1 Tax=Cupriavidus sp. BIC8F TaxID=3079014 RepID=UPI002916A571|nr:hypothetical protein [Cupriavidus sp. BIC8F]
MRLRFVSIALLSVPPLVFAGEVASGAQTTTLSVDADLVRLLKGAVYAGGIFLVIVAGIGVSFFGWDVRNARASLLDARKETRALLDELKGDVAHSKELMEKLEQLGAQLEEQSDRRLDVHQSGPADSIDADTVPFRSSEAEGLPGQSSAMPSSGVHESPRSNLELIRNIIAAGSYEWTTIGRIMNRTGLTRELVLEEVRKARDISIAKGKQSKDFIFKLESTR